MTLIGMGEAGKRLGVTSNSARRALQNAGIPLTVISTRSYAVEEADLQILIDKRGTNPGPGRPRKQEISPAAADISEGVEAERWKTKLPKWRFFLLSAVLALAATSCGQQSNVSLRPIPYPSTWNKSVVIRDHSSPSIFDKVETTAAWDGLAYWQSPLPGEAAAARARVVRGLQGLHPPEPIPLSALSGSEATCPSKRG